MITILWSTKFECSCCGHLCNMSTAILDENGWSERWTYRLPQNFQYYVSMQIHLFTFNINVGVSMMNKYLLIWVTYIFIIYKQIYFDFFHRSTVSHLDIRIFLYSILVVVKYYDCISRYATSVIRRVLR